MKLIPRPLCSPFDLQIAVIDDATNRPLIAPFDEYIW